MFTSSTPVAIVPVSEALDGSSEFYEVIHKKNYKPSMKTRHQQVQWSLFKILWLLQGQKRRRGLMMR